MRASPKRGNQSIGLTHYEAPRYTKHTEGRPKQHYRCAGVGNARPAQARKQAMSGYLRACSPALESLSRARLYARIVSKLAARSGQPQKLPNRLVSASAGYATAGPELFLRSWLSPV